MIIIRFPITIPPANPTARKLLNFLKFCFSCFGNKPKPYLSLLLSMGVFFSNLQILFSILGNRKTPSIVLIAISCKFSRNIEEIRIKICNSGRFRKETIIE